jgi:hypothetical protein
VRTAGDNRHSDERADSRTTPGTISSPGHRASHDSLLGVGSRLCFATSG